MSYISTANGIGFTDTATFAPAKAKVAQKRSLFGRFVDMVMAARMRHAEREIAQYLKNTGSKFTDDAEREIERRFLSTTSRW